MEPRIEIRSLRLRYRVQPRLVPSLDEAARDLAPLLDRALAGLDDGGRIVVIRRLSARVQLGRRVEPRFLAAWAQSLAEEVRAAVARARGGDEEEAVVFDGPLALLFRYVDDALRGRLGRWCWQPSSGALGAARTALAGMPIAGGDAPAWTASPAVPDSGSPAEAIGWALLTAGAALPELVRILDGAGLAAPALARIEPGLAGRLFAALAGGPLASAPATIASFSPVAATLRAIRRWPASDPRDPRSALLLVALTVAAHPALRSTPVLREAVASALSQRDSLSVALPAEAPISASSVIEPVPDPADRDTSDPRAPVENPFANAVPTHFGGALFLLHLVPSLGIVEAILDEPLLSAEPGPGLILYLTLCRLAPACACDPAALVFAGTDEPPPIPALPVDRPRLDAVLRVEARVAEAARRHEATASAADEARLRARAAAIPIATAPVPAWLDELCWRFAFRVAALARRRLGLAPDAPLDEAIDRVVCRRGGLLRTRTHVDVHFALDALDLDVRRAALDVDPGWVPWLGRVVGFHYA